MILTQYLIGTCLGCNKCLYCGEELNIHKNPCLCDKTVKPNKNNRTEKVKVAYPRISTPDLSHKQLQYIQESIARFGYSLDTNVKFKFTFCSACNSAFQRKKSSISTTSSSKNENGLVNDKPNQLINEFDIIEEEEELEQMISFDLVIKPSNGPTLSSKWMEIEILSLDDILANVHHYVKKLTGDKEIIYSDYLITFKPEKVMGSGAQLVDMHDYRKFLSDYKKLVNGNKNMMIIVSLKKREKQPKRKVNDFYYCVLL